MLSVLILDTNYLILKILFPNFNAMKKTILITFALTLSFGLGFAFNNLIKATSNHEAKIGRVTGLGGIFFKCKDPANMNAWYKAHLGINTNQYGAVFEWRHATDSTKKGFTNWNPFKLTTKYFGPSNQDFMIDYRVDNLAVLVENLKKEGVTIADTMQTANYGKFIHIVDVEGNKVELWEPVDTEYEKLGKQIGATMTK